jgi:hypothetical protein
MKAYKITTPFSYSQTNLVIADNMGEAEKIFEEKYKTRPEKIELISEYVQVKGITND